MLTLSLDNLKLRFMFSFDSDSLQMDLTKGGPLLCCVEEGKLAGFGMIKKQLLKENSPSSW